LQVVHLVDILLAAGVVLAAIERVREPVVVGLLLKIH
jgi:hypothetical protein